MKLAWIGLAAAIAMAGGAAAADTLHFAATLNGADVKGAGKLTASLDPETKALKYNVTYSGLSGPVTAAHFHGPAAPGADAPPVVPVPTKDLKDPIKGTATLSVEQMGQLEAGKWYFNIHTAAHPGGEIRGQVEETR